MTKTYTIDNKTYTQQPLVIGQVARLLAELKGVAITDISPLGLIAALGEKLPRLMACVLVPHGVAPQEVDIDTLADELAYSVDTETALEVLADFLSMADLASLFARLTTMLAQANQTAGKQTGAANSAPSSPEAIH
jgi:hypothetical protein